MAISVNRDRTETSFMEAADILAMVTLRLQRNKNRDVRDLCSDSISSRYVLRSKVRALLTTDTQLR